MKPVDTARREVCLRDLLVTTKDGDWGKADPIPGHTAYRVIRGTDFARARVGDLSSVPLRYLSDTTVWRRTLQPDDILIETAGGTSDRPTGRTLLVTQRILQGLGAPSTCASFARFLRVDPEIAVPAYIFWYLQHLYQQGEMRQHEVRHTGVGRFQYTRFAETEMISLPPIAEQRGIAATLGALDDKIESNQRISALLGDIVEAIFQRLLETSEVSWLNFDQVVKRLPVVNKHSGKTVSTVGSTVVLDQGQGGVLGYHDGPSEFSTTPEKPICLFGDHTCTWRLGVGQFDVGPNVIPVTTQPSAGIHPIWMYYSLLGVQQFQEYRRHWMEFSIHKIPWVSSDVQDHFVANAGPAIALDNTLTCQNHALTALRDTLLPELVSGRIRVPEAEEALAGVGV